MLQTDPPRNWYSNSARAINRFWVRLGRGRPALSARDWKYSCKARSGTLGLRRSGIMDVVGEWHIEASIRAGDKCPLGQCSLSQLESAAWLFSRHARTVPAAGR